MFVRYALGFLSAAVIGLVVFSVQPSPQRDALFALVGPGNTSSQPWCGAGAYCNVSYDPCCNGTTCHVDSFGNGTCGVSDSGNCYEYGAACTGDGDCCTSMCVGGICGGSGNVSSSCRQDGESCSLDEDCCNSLCRGSVCGAPEEMSSSSADACQPDGAMCAGDVFCCSGNCDMGTCQEPGAGSSASSAPSCLGYGADCLLAPMDCCNAGPTPLSCQLVDDRMQCLPAACIATGQACIFGAECCNGICEDNICGGHGAPGSSTPTTSASASAITSVTPPGPSSVPPTSPSSVPPASPSSVPPTPFTPSSTPPVVTSSSSSTCPMQCTGGSFLLQMFTLGFAGNATCVVPTTCSTTTSEMPVTSPSSVPPASVAPASTATSPPASSAVSSVSVAASSVTSVTSVSVSVSSVPASSVASSSSSIPNKVCCTLTLNEDEEEVRGCTLTPTEAACTALGAGNKWLPGKPSCSASEYDDNVDPCLLPDLVARAKPLLGYEPEGAPISVGMMFASLSGDVWNEGDAAAHNVKAVFTVPPPMRVGTEFEFASGGTCTINKARTQITCTASKLEPDEGISVGAFVMIPEGASPVPQCNQEYILNVTGSTSDTEVTTENNSDQYRYFYSCGACCPHVDDPDRTCRYVSEEQCPTDNPFFTPTWLAPPFARCSLCPQRSSSSASSSAPTTGACCYVDSKPPSYSTTIERGVTESQCEIIKKGVYHPGNPPDSDISCPTAGDLKVTKSGPGVAEVKPGDTVSYTVTVENASDTDMTGTVGLVDSADPWLIVDETSMPEGCRKLQTLISCEMHGLSKGDSKSFTFTYTVSPTACPNRSSLSANSATVFAGAGNYDLNPLNNLAFSDTATLLCGDVGVCCTYEAGKPVAQCAGPSTAALCTGSDKTFVAGKQCSQPGVCPERPTGTCCGFSSLTQQLVSCQKNVTASGCAYGDFHEGENTGSCAEICTPPEYGTCCTLSGCEAKSTESRCSLIGGKWTKGENKCAECKPLGPCCKGPSAVQCEPATTEDECDADGGQWLGQGKYCSLCQYDVGVCCSATGEAMENVTQEMCGSMTGMDQPTVWLSGKDKNSCPKPGACCVVDPINDNCAQLTYDACKTRTGGVGNFRGEGVACPSSCKPSEPVGACCRPGLPCLENQTESQCLSMSPPGKWSGKATCATACPMGACCFMNSSGTEPQCASYDKQTCESVYKGTPMPGQACSACIKWFCYAGAYDPEGTKSCRSMMAAGDYLPAPDAVAYGTAGDCAAGCTPLAHCCDEDTNSCSPVMTGVSCKKGTTSADPQCGGSCAPAQKGACCESNGACSLTTEAACSGSFKGAETSCTTANICGAATVKAACCVGNACSEKTNAECTAAGGTSMGSPSCTLDLCADAPKGACCTATGCQSDKTQTECSAMAGTWNQGKTCDQVNQCKPAPGPGGCCAKDLIGEGVSCNYNLSETDCAQIPGQTWYPQNCSAQCNTMPVAACGPNCQPAVNGTCSLVAQEPSGWWASLLASLGFRTAQNFFEGTDLDFDGMIDCCCKPQGGTSSSAGGGTSSPPASSAQPEPKQCGACVGDSQTACENGQYACVWDGNALGFLQVLFGGSGGTCKPAPQCVGGSGGGTGNTGGTAGSSRPTQASSASSIVLALSAPSSAATVSSAIASVTPAPPASATSSSSSGPSFFSSSSSSRQKEAIIGLRIPQLCPPGLILKRDGSCGPIAVCPDPTNRGDIARYCRDVECRDSTNPAACLAGCTCGCVADRPAETTHRQEAAACVRACTTGTNTLCGANPTNECCQVACTGQHCPLPRQDDPLEI